MNDLGNKDYYVNRELSWLMFDERVLGEATDTSNPLMERLKFLSITASSMIIPPIGKNISTLPVILSWSIIVI